MPKANTNKQIMKLLHKFDRYDKREKVFIFYLLLLTLFILILPVIKISEIKGGSYSIGIWKLGFSLLIILVSLIVLLGWNISFKCRNLISNYFGGRNNGPLINFLFLFIIFTIYFVISDTIRISSGELTTSVSVSGGCIFIEILLVLGMVLTLISVIKNAKENSKKTKIINMVDEEREKQSEIKEDIKKGLFE